MEQIKNLFSFAFNCSHGTISNIFETPSCFTHVFLPVIWDTLKKFDKQSSTNIKCYYKFVRHKILLWCVPMCGGQIEVFSAIVSWPRKTALICFLCFDQTRTSSQFHQHFTRVFFVQKSNFYLRFGFVIFLYKKRALKRWCNRHQNTGKAANFLGTKSSPIFF